MVHASAHDGPDLLGGLWVAGLEAAQDLLHVSNDLLPAVWALVGEKLRPPLNRRILDLVYGSYFLVSSLIDFCSMILAAFTVAIRPEFMADFLTMSFTFGLMSRPGHIGMLFTFDAIVHDLLLC